MKPETVPLPIVISPEVKPVTDSEKVMLIGIGEVFVKLDAELVTETFGGILVEKLFLVIVEGEFPSSS